MVPLVFAWWASIGRYLLVILGEGVRCWWQRLRFIGSITVAYRNMFCPYFMISKYSGYQFFPSANRPLLFLDVFFTPSFFLWTYWSRKFLNFTWSFQQGMMVEYAKKLADFAAASGKKHVVMLSGLDFGRLQRIDMSRYSNYLSMFSTKCALRKSMKKHQT